MQTEAPSTAEPTHQLTAHAHNATLSYAHPTLLTLQSARATFGMVIASPCAIFFADCAVQLRKCDLEHVSARFLIMS
jgi:hypothetical protein